jgi:hypothetical protein
MAFLTALHGALHPDGRDGLIVFLTAVAQVLICCCRSCLFVGRDHLAALLR